MNNTIIKIKDSDLFNLKYITGKINVSDIRDYRKINRLLTKFSNGVISKDEYVKGYEQIVNEAKKSLNSFKNKFSELYICNMILQKESKIGIELAENIYFDKIVEYLNLSIKNKLVPQNIFQTIIEFDTSDIMEEVAKSNCRVKLTNSESFSNVILINNINKKFDKLSQQKTFVKK